MWISHKPYCGLGEGSKELLFFQTPLSEIEFHDFVSSVCTSSKHNLTSDYSSILTRHCPSELDARFLESLTPGVSNMFKSLVGRRIIQGQLNKTSSAIFLTTKNFLCSDGNLLYFRERWADMYFDRKEYELNHDTAAIRFLLTMDSDAPDPTVTSLNLIYAICPPSPIRLDSDLCRKVTSPYYFAMLDLNTVIIPSNTIEVKKEAYERLWGRVRQTVKVMKDTGYERFIWEGHEADERFYESAIGSM